MSQQPTSQSSGRGLLERVFKLREHGTTVRTEAIAGFTTFLTMVYIVFVNPQILGVAGMDTSAVFCDHLSDRGLRQHPDGSVRESAGGASASDGSECFLPSW